MSTQLAEPKSFSERLLAELLAECEGDDERFISTAQERATEFVPYLIADLAHPDGHHFALRLLGFAQDERAVESLISLLRPDALVPMHAIPEDRSLRYRLACCLSPGLRNEKRHLETLLRRATRRCAALSLGRLGDPRAIEPLLAIRDDEDEHVRWAARWALERLGVSA